MLSIRAPVEQRRLGMGNPDASLSVAEPGIDADVRRAHNGRDACPDSDSQRLVTTADVPAAHIPRCNSGCRDHRGCRSARGCGSGRTDSVVRGVPLASKANGGLDGNVRFVKYSACNVARLGAGRGIGSDLAVGTGVAPAFPPAGRLSTSSATAALPNPCRASLARQRLLRNPSAKSPAGCKS